MQLNRIKPYPVGFRYIQNILHTSRGDTPYSALSEPDIIDEVQLKKQSHMMTFSKVWKDLKNK